MARLRRIGTAALAIGALACSLPGTVARRTAASDHDCPVNQVRVEAEERQGDQPWAYWLNVCGTRRYYRRDEATLGTGSVQFYDATATAVGRVGVAASDRDSPLYGVPVQGRVRSRYDETAHGTALELTLPIGRAVLRFEGVPTAGDALRVTAVAMTADRYQWTGCQAIALAPRDGDALPIGEIRYRFGRQRDGAYIEQVSGATSFVALERLLASPGVHGLVCGTAFDVTERQGAAIAEFVTRWRRGAAGRATAAEPDAGPFVRDASAE